MKRTAIARACMLLAGSALAHSASEKTSVNSALADFVKDVAISDRFEIEAAKLAKDKGNAPEKAFATQMVTDHTKTSAELKGFVSSGRVKAEMPTALDSSQQARQAEGRKRQGFQFRFRSRCSSGTPRAATMRI